MKKYIAKTNVSINIVLANGKNRHIAFNALTGGGSVFYTNDPDIIDAMEHHYRYGTLFQADTRYIAERQHNKPAPKPKPGIAAQPTLDVNTSESSGERTVTENTSETDEIPEAEQSDEGEDNGPKRIVVSDPDDAKTYLAEHFGYSRTKIKTLKAITEAAAANGIVFDGI